MSRSPAHDARNSQLRLMFGVAGADTPNFESTGVVIAKGCDNLNVAHHVEDIPNSNGAKLHFAGDIKSEKVILYFHGEQTFLGLSRVTISSERSKVAAMQCPHSLAI